MTNINPSSSSSSSAPARTVSTPFFSEEQDGAIKLFNAVFPDRKQHQHIQKAYKTIEAVYEKMKGAKKGEVTFKIEVLLKALKKIGAWKEEKKAEEIEEPSTPPIETDEALIEAEHKSFEEKKNDKY